MRKLFKFYINSSVHVSLAVISLALVTAVHFHLIIDLEFLFFLFFGTVTGYNFVKFAGVAKLHHRSLAKSLKIIQVFSFLSFLAFVYFSLLQSMEVLIAAAFFGVLTLLYALPVFSGKKNLRGLKGLKVFVIAVVWAGVTVVLPILNTFYPEHLTNFSNDMVFEPLGSLGPGENNQIVPFFIEVPGSLITWFSGAGVLLPSIASSITLFLEFLFFDLFKQLIQPVFTSPNSEIFISDIILEFIQRFLFILVLILPFEIRDLKYDSEELRTIPQNLGVERTKMLAYLCLCIWIILEFFKNTTNLPSLISIVATAVITAGFVQRARENQPEYYSSFWVEGIPIVWILVLFVTTNYL